MVTRNTSSARLNKEDGFALTVTIPNSAVLTLNSVGYTLIPPPSNSFKALYLIELVAKITTQTPYTSVHSMTVGYGSPLSQGVVICSLPGAGFLDQSVPTGVNAVFNGTSGLGTIISRNSGPISILMGTSNPANGTSPLVIAMKYKTHNLP